MKLISFVMGALVLTGCAPAASAPASTSGGPAASAPASASGGPAASASASTSPSRSAEARLPLVTGLPVPLAAGTYLTPEGFEPIMAVTLPTGWYGGASLNDFGVGQGLDEVNQRFGGGGIFVGPIDMPYDQAVAEFGKLEGLAHDREPTTGTLGGYEATTFYAHAPGAHVVLDPIAPGADIGTAAAQQVFVDADGTTVLIRMELNDDAARAEIEGVIASIEFPAAGS